MSSSGENLPEEVVNPQRENKPRRSVGYFAQPTGNATATWTRTWRVAIRPGAAFAARAGYYEQPTDDDVALRTRIRVAEASP